MARQRSHDPSVIENECSYRKRTQNPGIIPVCGRLRQDFELEDSLEDIVRHCLDSSNTKSVQRVIPMLVLSLLVCGEGIFMRQGLVLCSTS